MHVLLGSWTDLCSAPVARGLATMQTACTRLGSCRDLFQVQGLQLRMFSCTGTPRGQVRLLCAALVLDHFQMSLQVLSRSLCTCTAV